MTLRRASALVLFALVAAVPASASAERFAVLISNNRGWLGEVPLQFAHRDADRLADTLIEIGGFARSNVVQLNDSSPDEVRAVLQQLTKRSKSGGEPSLFVLYYSGHADEDGLHLGTHALSYGELKQLVARVPANVHLSLLDSCNSGAMTRLKGQLVAPFSVEVGAGSAISGDVSISAASASEAAQESDQLKGSFFTSYLTTGLRGGADANHDGKVTLEELYEFAYDKTVGQTSATLAGIQHPARRYDLRGQGMVVLSYPGRSKACLVFAPELNRQHFLVLAPNDDVVAEVTPQTKGYTRLALQAGSYQVRTRNSAGVFQTDVRLLAEECRQVQTTAMRRVILPETLSKGQLLRETWSLGFGYMAALGNLGEKTLPLHGWRMTGRIPVGAHWALRPMTSYQWASAMGKVLPIYSKLWGLDAAFTRDFATPYGLFAVGPFAGYSLLWQDVPTVTHRHVSGLQTGALAQFSVPLPWWHLALDVMGQLGYARLGFKSDGTSRLLANLGTGLSMWW